MKATTEVSAFALARSSDGPWEVLAVRGDIDLFTARHLRLSLDEIIWRTRSSVLVDLTDARSIDTHGVVTLLNGTRRLERGGRRLAILCPSLLRRAFAVTGTERLVDLVADTDVMRDG